MASSDVRFGIDPAGAVAVILIMLTLAMLALIGVSGLWVIFG